MHVLVAAYIGATNATPGNVTISEYEPTYGIVYIYQQPSAVTSFRCLNKYTNFCTLVVSASTCFLQVTLSLMFCPKHLVLFTLSKAGQLQFLKEQSACAFS